MGRSSVNDQGRVNVLDVDKTSGAPLRRLQRYPSSTTKMSRLLGCRRCWGASCKMYTEIVTRISLALTLSSSANAEHYPSLCVRNILISFSSESVYIAGMRLLVITCFYRYITVDVSLVNFS